MDGATASKEGDVIIELKDVAMYFGKVAALAGATLQVHRGEIHSVIGPNGAGKTVMMNCISGLYRPQKGEIFFKGERINDHHLTLAEKRKARGHG